MAARGRRSNQLQWVIVLLFLSLVLVLVLKPREPPPSQLISPGSYLFCFWNVENLFDDRDDRRGGPGDEEYDPWFARNPELLRQKLDHLCKALLGLNGGRGPDILAVAEVESERAANLLCQELNARLSDPSLHYGPPLMKEVSSGRHIAPAILTRLPAQRDRTHLLNPRLRILEGHLHVNGHQLVILASHWTSQVSDKKDVGREKYAKQLYGRFKEMYLSNPEVDVLICGDFNDPPDDPVVINHLHAVGDRAAVLRCPAEQPLLFNLFAGKDPKQFGTLYHHRWFIYDQIVVSPGLLDDRGWSCEVDSVQTVRTLHRSDDSLRRPWSFGRAAEKGPRGYSDHFPVTVQLKVADGSGR